MGVGGLLPLVSEIAEDVELAKYAGKTVAVDGSSWIYRGAYGCASGLASSDNDIVDSYVAYTMDLIYMLKYFKIIPYLVFDGRPLPMKSTEHAERSRTKGENRAAADKLVSEGKHEEANVAFQRSISITSQMVQQVIQACREHNIQFVVAPYEADAQLAYLNRCGIADAVITEDSDLIIFGCTEVLYKVRKGQSCKRIKFADVLAKVTVKTTSKKKNISLAKWDLEKLRHMCMFAGCDYLPKKGDQTHIAGLGLKKACQLLDLHGTPDRVIKAMKATKGVKVPAKFEEYFKQAEITFKHQLCYDPRKKRLTPLNPYPTGMNVDDISFAGPRFPQSEATQLANGLLCAIKMKQIFPKPFSLSTTRKLNTYKALHDGTDNSWGVAAPVVPVSQETVRRRINEATPKMKRKGHMKKVKLSIDHITQYFSTPDQPLDNNDFESDLSQETQRQVFAFESEDEFDSKHNNNNNNNNNNNDNDDNDNDGDDDNNDDVNNDDNIVDDDFDDDDGDYEDNDSDGNTIVVVGENDSADIPISEIIPDSPQTHQPRSLLSSRGPKRLNKRSPKRLAERSPQLSQSKFPQNSSAGKTTPPTKTAKNPFAIAVSSQLKQQRSQPKPKNVFAALAASSMSSEHRKLPRAKLSLLDITSKSTTTTPPTEVSVASPASHSPESLTGATKKMTGTARQSDQKKKASSKFAGVKTAPSQKKKKPALANSKPYFAKIQTIKITSVDTEEEIEVVSSSPEKKNIFLVPLTKQNSPKSTAKKSAISGWIANFKSQTGLSKQDLPSALSSSSSSSSSSLSLSPSKSKSKSKLHSPTKVKAVASKRKQPYTQGETMNTGTKSNKKQRLKPKPKESPLLQHFKKQNTKT